MSGQVRLAVAAFVAVFAVFLMAVFTRGDAPARPGYEITEYPETLTAVDGQTLGSQTLETQTLFYNVFDGSADAEWVFQHHKDLVRNEAYWRISADLNAVEVLTRLGVSADTVAGWIVEDVVSRNSTYAFLIGCDDAVLWGIWYCGGKPPVEATRTPTEATKTPIVPEPTVVPISPQQECEEREVKSRWLPNWNDCVPFHTANFYTIDECKPVGGVGWEWVDGKCKRDYGSDYCHTTHYMFQDECIPNNNPLIDTYRMFSKSWNPQGELTDIKCKLEKVPTSWQRHNPNYYFTSISACQEIPPS